ncbi:hypothetical protein Trydic_g2180 [Trypoxylus dichotomus]
MFDLTALGLDAPIEILTPGFALTLVSARHGGVPSCTIENRRPSREKHGRAFLEKRSQKKKARQCSGPYLLRRHNHQATSDQIPMSDTGFPNEIGSSYTSRHRSRTDVWHPLSATDRAKQARSHTQNPDLQNRT